MTTINRDNLSPINRANLSHLRRAPRVADQLRLDREIRQKIFRLAR